MRYPSGPHRYLDIDLDGDHGGLDADDRGGEDAGPPPVLDRAGGRSMSRKGYTTRKLAKRFSRSTREDARVGMGGIDRRPRPSKAQPRPFGRCLG
jgi:hypothetical protein